MPKRTIVGHQGDVIVERISAVPKSARKLATKKIEMHSESGVNHVLDVSAAFAGDNETNYAVLDEASTMTHTQHPKLDLAPGIYAIRHVRDYTPRRNMLD
ncbi:MAG: hypothetical protein JRN62_03505 [Nitrososphaerota archaeon]|jgi:hypothetical protein|nr:hypothetical protein [Nitrososphaerota archaeon]MDG6948667.1 hypothetical protein [Nitrososphaerota archaeon]